MSLSEVNVFCFIYMINSVPDILVLFLVNFLYLCLQHFICYDSIPQKVYKCVIKFHFQANKTRRLFISQLSYICKCYKKQNNISGKCFLFYWEQKFRCTLIKNARHKLATHSCLTFLVLHIAKKGRLSREDSRKNSKTTTTWAYHCLLLFTLCLRSPKYLS